MSDSKREVSLLKRQDDFDYWMDLAERDPECFEEYRTRLLNEYIANTPEEKQEHLRRLQWRVDQSRRLAKNPIDAMNRISRLMWDELLRLNNHQKQLIAMMTGRYSKQVIPQPESATILTFPVRRAPK